MTGSQDPAEAPSPPTSRRTANRPPGPANSGTGRVAPGWAAYLADPRTAVLFFLASAFVIGGGRKGLQAIRARRVVAAIGGANPDVLDVEAAADHGRAGLVELFRLLGTADRPEVRDAAGRSLARLWKADEMIAEEEKGIVRRGFTANWQARRRYPRALSIPIPITVDFGVPFLTESNRGVGPSHLSWSYRILGTERAHLEDWIESKPGATSATFAIVPDDFATLGPHRLVLHARVKTVGLTDAWELELPHLPFSFEFDTNLAVDALLTLPDDARGTTFARAVRLQYRGESETPPEPLDLGPEMVLRDPPVLSVAPPIPCDLAHHLSIEFEGIAGTWPAGTVIALANSPTDSNPSFSIGPIPTFPPEAIDRPGPRRIRAILTADPNLGWTVPEVRSIWPGTITTDWFDVRIIRR